MQVLPDKLHIPRIVLNILHIPAQRKLRSVELKVKTKHFKWQTVSTVSYRCHLKNVPFLYRFCLLFLKSLSKTLITFLLEWGIPGGMMYNLHDIQSKERPIQVDVIDGCL